jgi:hypothetical protein
LEGVGWGGGNHEESKQASKKERKKEKKKLERKKQTNKEDQRDWPSTDTVSVTLAETGSSQPSRSEDPAAVPVLRRRSLLRYSNNPRL